MDKDLVKVDGDSPSRHNYCTDPPRWNPGRMKPEKRAQPASFPWTVPACETKMEKLEGFRLQKLSHFWFCVLWCLSQKGDLRNVGSKWFVSSGFFIFSSAISFIQHVGVSNAINLKHRVKTAQSVTFPSTSSFTIICRNCVDVEEAVSQSSGPGAVNWS